MLASKKSAPAVMRALPREQPAAPLSFDATCNHAVELVDHVRALAARIPADNTAAQQAVAEALAHAREAVHALTALSMRAPDLL